MKTALHTRGQLLDPSTPTSAWSAPVLFHHLQALLCLQLELVTPAQVLPCSSPRSAFFRRLPVLTKTEALPSSTVTALARVSFRHAACPRFGAMLLSLHSTTDSAPVRYLRRRAPCHGGAPNSSRHHRVLYEWRQPPVRACRPFQAHHARLSLSHLPACQRLSISTLSSPKRRSPFDRFNSKHRAPYKSF